MFLFSGLGLHDIWAEERKRVIEGRGKLPVEKRSIEENPNSKMTKIRKLPEIETRPEPILSKKTISESVLRSEKSSESIRPEKNVGTKRQFVFSNDSDLEDLEVNFDDLENDVSSKKTKLDKSLDDRSTNVVQQTLTKIVGDNSINSSFSVSQDFPTTSTQIANNARPTLAETSKADQNESTKSVDLSPLSNKTLSKLRAFLAPPKENSDSSSKTDEGNGTSIVDKDVTKQTSIVDKNVTKQTPNVGKDSSCFSETSKVDNNDVTSKSSADEGNGSSIVATNVVHKTSTDANIVPKKSLSTNFPSVVKNRVVLTDKKPSNVEDRQRSILASIFSDPSEVNFDDLDF